MPSTSLLVQLILIGGLPLLLNALALLLLLFRKCDREVRASTAVLSFLLVADILLSALLVLPVRAFLSPSAAFTEQTCDFYGAADFALSIFQISLTTLVAFDRYIVTIRPSWGGWRSTSNYLKVMSGQLAVSLLWSALPLAGYGSYSVYGDGLFCSLDWKQGNVPTAGGDMDALHRYIALLTATFLLFFLIPVCIASAFYYSIVEHIERLNSAEVREETSAVPLHTPWAPSGHGAKICTACLLVLSLPYLGYSLVSLNPFKSNFENMNVVVAPMILARLSCLFNPLFYVFLNPQLVPLHAISFLQRQRPRKGATVSALLAGPQGRVGRSPTAILSPSRPSYQTINVIAAIPGHTMPILAPSVGRRQLPQIPVQGTSPQHGPPVFFYENKPLL